MVPVAQFFFLWLPVFIDIYKIIAKVLLKSIMESRLLFLYGSDKRECIILIFGGNYILVSFVIFLYFSLF